MGVALPYRSPRLPPPFLMGMLAPPAWAVLVGWEPAPLLITKPKQGWGRSRGSVCRTGVAPGQVAFGVGPRLAQVPPFFNRRWAGYDLVPPT